MKTFLFHSTFFWNLTWLNTLKKNYTPLSLINSAKQHAWHGEEALPRIAQKEASSLLFSAGEEGKKEHFKLQQRVSDSPFSAA